MSVYDVFFLCTDPDRDPCAPHVLAALRTFAAVRPRGDSFDGQGVLEAERADGTKAVFVLTRDVVSNDYATYVDRMREGFADARLAVVVNWHEGANAPDRVLTFHSTGDVPSGTFAPTSGAYFAGYLRTLEAAREAEGLSNYRTAVEATHWSGVTLGGDPQLIPRYPRPIFDLEIGSAPESWSDPAACRVLARTCLEGPNPSGVARSGLYCGGVHFEENVTEAMLAGRWEVGHVLPNQWLRAGDYHQPAARQKLRRCLESHLERPSALVVHKGASSALRTALATFAADFGLSHLTHRQLRPVVDA